MIGTLDGPDGFFRNTFVLQENDDSWPVIYVWEGSHIEDSAPVSVFVFQAVGGRANATTVPPTWDQEADYRRGTGVNYDGPRIELTYAQWWAFIYFLSTEFPKHLDSDAVEEKFHEQILQPQTSKEKANV